MVKIAKDASPPLSLRVNLHLHLTMACVPLRVDGIWPWMTPGACISMARGAGMYGSDRLCRRGDDIRSAIMTRGGDGALDWL